MMATTAAISDKAIWFEKLNTSCAIRVNQYLKKEFNFPLGRIVKIILVAAVSFALYVTLYGKIGLGKCVIALNYKDPLRISLGDTYIYYKSLEYCSFKTAKRLKESPRPSPYGSWCMDQIWWMMDKTLIPEELLSDDFLFKNKCPITHHPIRHPVYHDTTDRYGKKVRMYYEEIAIMAWLKYSDTAPFNHKVPLKVEDLKKDTELESLIQKRIELLTEDLSKLEPYVYVPPY